MTNYYPVIARGISGLKDNSAESRRALYARVQTALVEQLRELDPPLEEPEILRERLSFAEAVRRAEADAASLTGAGSGGPRATRRTSTRTRVAGLHGPAVATAIDAPDLVPDGGTSVPRGLRRAPRSRPPAPAAKRRGRFIHIIALLTAWFVVLATVALAFAMYWHRDQLKAWLGTGPNAAWQRVVVPSRPKITDRVGPGQPAASGQRASLYEEDPGDQQGKRHAGSVNWKTEMLSPQETSPELAIRAELEIPERHLRMTMAFRRNPDKMLPASHTVEIAFRPAGDFGEISNIPALLMKAGELSDGSRLAGVTAKVTSGLFLIGLSAADGDLQHNLQMLKAQGWFDIPIVYEDGRRAIVALEKGASGERAFQEAFAAWGE
jgi:hypothetical protein